MLDIDPAGTGAGQVADELFVPGTSAERILPEDLQKLLGPASQVGRGELFSVFLRLFREAQPPPAYQSISSAPSSTGVSIPSRIDSLMPGIESRYIVSWMARQSCSETSTALDLLPVIWTGSLESTVSSMRR